MVAVATPAAHAAKKATSTIPIVMNVSDPLATGLVTSLARPEANLDGDLDHRSRSRGQEARAAEGIPPWRDAFLRHGFLLIAEQPSFATAGALAAYGENRR